ncbi:helix-turn-helix domain-containing protein [Corynebacterium flavescens]|uniref:helix-turn-helix domain-containing protein n=1 Tax=Corynebacterium flavescens TaxID=28028 RepID=UPI003F910BE7
MAERPNYSAINLKKLRTDAGMSRSDLLRELKSRGVGVHMTTLRRLEEGQQQMKVEELIAICDVFEMTLDQFVHQPIDETTARLTEILRDLRQTRAGLSFQLSALHHELQRLDQVLSEPETPAASQSAIVKEMTELLDYDTPYRDRVEDLLHHFSEEPRDSGSGSR